jgi:mono/diheme cytochrome c family protein
MTFCEMISTAQREGRVWVTAFSIGVLLFSAHLDRASAEEIPADHAAQMTRSMELFKAQVGALLKQHCLACHGGEKTESQFDLTTREGLLKGGEHGSAVVPGKPEESLLVKLLRHQAEPNMPAEAEKLPDAAIEQISQWIASGAAYDRPLADVAESFLAKQVPPEASQFWSFQPLAQTSPPAVKNQSWCRTPIDQFIQSKLEAKGLTANGPADRRKLIRRAYFDLTGLPPSQQDVEDFLGDGAADAFDRVVDRLLESPHYGERWGRHWLDLARFAESHGYEQDYDRPSAYHYRDFVIQALNQDMPYDHFVKWQLAGDEIAPDNNQALMATGFLAAGTHATQITASQVEKERYDELDDMAATVGTAMLGLTIGCARCHDHKYDPIPQADYYRLLSTFTTTVRSEMELDFDPEANRQAKAAFDRDHQPLIEALARYESEVQPALFEAWLAKNVPPAAPRWLIVGVDAVKSDGGATFATQEDLSYLVKDKNPASDTYTLVVNTRRKNITGVRIEALSDPSLPQGGPGRASNGNFALSDFQLWAAPMGTEGPGAPAKLANPKATFQQDKLPVVAAIDDNKKTAWAIDPQVGKNHAASFELEMPLSFENGAKLTFILKFENNPEHTFGRVRLSIAQGAKPLSPDGEQAAERQLDQVHQALARPADQRSAADRALLLEWFRQHDAEWLKLRAAVREHERHVPRPQLTKVLVSTEGLPAIRLHTQGGDFLEHTHFLKRGDVNQKLAVAEQGFLQVLSRHPDGARHWQETPPPLWRTSYRRKALAHWITDTQAGAGNLLARVIVNRLWQHHLGQAIVSTPSDFGTAGARPTHPELLEYLAGQLIAGQWKLKDIHKQIMTSAVYMQSTDTDAARQAIDPDNTLHWRRNRQRLEAEVIRDAMLAASGQLDETMFGPGTLDEGHRRRSIYFTTKRSQLVPSMMLFDAPDSLQGLGQRASTIVAPQALAMLNNQQVQACAQAFAAKLAAGEQTTVEEAVRRAYLAAVARPADSAELDLAVAYLRKTAASYQAAGKNDSSQAALADFCQVILSLNEFIYID